MALGGGMVGLAVGASVGAGESATVVLVGVGGSSVGGSSVDVAVAVLVATGAGVWLGVGVGGISVAVAGLVAVAEGRLVAVVATSVLLATGCMAIGMPVGGGVLVVVQAAASTVTATSAANRKAHPRRCSICLPFPFSAGPSPFQSWRQVPPPEQAGVLHRSSRPQHVRPAGRRASSLMTCGAEKRLPPASKLPQLGQAGTLVWERTRTSTSLPQLAHWYS